MTCDCLQKLERSVWHQMTLEGTVSEQGSALQLVHSAIRAALNAGPQQAGTNTGVTLGDLPAGSAGGLATRVHVVSPGHNWGSQMWSVVQDDGGLFCLTFYADSAEGGRARKVAELIARAVNALNAPQDPQGGVR